jgi:hypothetical protein
LTKKQKEQILKSHIFVEQKRDGLIKARKVIGGNKQQDYITKEDVSSPTVTAEAVMLTCVIDAQEDRDIAVVDIPNAFVQTVVNEEDAVHRVIVRISIRGPLVDILVSIVPDVYGPYVKKHLMQLCRSTVMDSYQSQSNGLKTPAPDNLFAVNEDCDKLLEAASADFHTIVAKTLYVTKRARPDGPEGRSLYCLNLNCRATPGRFFRSDLTGWWRDV